MGSTISGFSQMGVDQLRERSLECISIFTALHYESGNISTENFEFLQHSIDSGGFRKSDVIFLLHLPGSIAFARAIRRGRKEELVGLLESYCIQLNSAYFNTMKTLDCVVILLDASKSQDQLLDEFCNAFNCASSAFGRPALPHDISRLHYLSARQLPTPPLSLSPPLILTTPLLQPSTAHEQNS